MKNIIKLVLVVFVITLSLNTNAQTKVKVLEDAFVQGGETSETTFGTDKPKMLRIFNSQKEGKYSRIVYLKFKLPKNIKEDSKTTLHFPIKVFINKNDGNLLFNLDVFTVTTNDWNENKITWNTKPAEDVKVGEIKIAQSLNKKWSWQKIELNSSELLKLAKSQKDNTITLALLNNEFNKISSNAPSKETSKKVASYLTIE